MKKQLTALAVALGLGIWICPAIALTESDGRVGIGTISPQNVLHVRGGMPGNRSGLTIEYPGGSSLWSLNTGDSSSALNQRLGFDNSVAGTVMTLTESKRVGIGTTDPQNLLHIKGTMPGNRTGITIEYTGGTPWAIQTGDGSSALHQRLGFDSPMSGTVMTLHQDGRVGIGTTDPLPGYKLTVNGGIFATQIRVRKTLTTDYVFQPDYPLMPLRQLEMYIRENRHLPGIPSQEELDKTKSVDLAEMQTKLLEKIEELTLYTIELQHQIDVLSREK